MKKNILDQWKNQGGWRPPSDWIRITAIDAHAAGEPLRVITGGYPELPGKTILERRRYAKAGLDHLRTALMWEPRGHADMYGCIITPAVSPEADFGVLFLHNEGYSTMCGHGIIAVVTVILETGMLPIREPQTRIVIDTPAGPVTAYARIDSGQVKSVYFHNVPSYVVELDAEVNAPGLGPVRYDLAFGGAYYAFVDAESVGLRCRPEDVPAAIEKGMAVKRAVMQQRKIEHPFDSDLGFLYGTIFIAPPEDGRRHSRNVCIFAEGEVDRSPTGTGVSARAAIHHARGELKPGEKMTIESIIGATFTASVKETVQFGPYPAVIPEVEGQAFITGKHEFLIDPNDPLSEGFMLR